VLVPVEIAVPDEPGRHMLELDLVHEHVRWFGAGLRLTLDVEGPPLVARVGFVARFPQEIGASGR